MGVSANHGSLPPVVAPFDRVRNSLRAWEKIGAAPVVLDWIANGYRLPFVAELPPFYHQPLHHNETQQQELQLIMNKLFSIGVLERTDDDTYVSRSRLEPKKDGGYRLIVDLRCVNSYLEQQPCKFETLKDLQLMIQPEDWMISADLKDGYYHLAIHPQHRKYLTTVINGVLVRFLAFPFGLCTAPRVFTKFMRPVVRYFRSNNINMLQYLDDSLFIHPSHCVLYKIRKFVDNTFSSLGLARNVNKGVWEPTQQLVHLGIGIDTVRGLFLVPPHKQATLKAAAASLLRYASSHRRWVTAKKVQNICGLAISLSIAFPVARTVTRSLYDAITDMPSWKRDVQLSKQAIRDLQFLATVPEEFCDKAIWTPKPLVTIHTDASDTGWGAVLQDLVPAQGFFGRELVHQHITVKELRAVLEALQSFRSNLHGKVIRIVTDNMTVKAIINSGVSRSPYLMPIYREILSLCLEQGVVLQAEYIPTALNVKADFLSRISPRSDWSVSDELFEFLQQLFGQRTFDRFASPSSARCKNYNSVIPHPDSSGDAFQQSWLGHENWICPPISLVSKVVDRLMHEGAEAVVVVPYWPSATWFPALISMADFVRPLSREAMEEIIAHGPGPPEILKNPRWRLMIVHVPHRVRTLLRC